MNGNGPGKYDYLCTYVREMSRAQCALVIVINGDKGSGFSLQMVEDAMFDPDKVATLLENTARSIREGER